MAKTWAELLPNLQAPPRSQREAAVRELGSLPDPRALEWLIRALGDGRIAVRVAADQALLGWGLLAMEPLIRALDNHDWPQRCEVVLLLGQAGD